MYADYALGFDDACIFEIIEFISNLWGKRMESKLVENKDILQTLKKKNFFCFSDV